MYAKKLRNFDKKDIQKLDSLLQLNFNFRRSLKDKHKNFQIAEIVPAHVRLMKTIMSSGVNSSYSWWNF